MAEMQFPAFLMLAAAALGTTAAAADPPKLPEPYKTPSASNGPKLVKQPDGVSL